MEKVPEIQLLSTYYTITKVPFAYGLHITIQHSLVTDVWFSAAPELHVWKLVQWLSVP